jgi:hypothetical protein
MYIIFGKDSADQVSTKYTVLELDVLQLEPDGPLVPTYCLIEPEHIALGEMPQLENFVNLHTKLMENYRKKNWNFCEQALSHLHGRWNGSLDSFYDEMSDRVRRYKTTDPGPEWAGVFRKYKV